MTSFGEGCWGAALLLHDCEVALHKQLHSFITMEINLNVYQSQSLFFWGGIYVLLSSGRKLPKFDEKCSPTQSFMHQSYGSHQTNIN